MRLDVLCLQYVLVPWANRARGLDQGHPPVAPKLHKRPMSTIYRKTAKGQAEIETRAHRLPPRLRGALILVNGQRSEADLAKLIPLDPESTLSALLAEGFIDVFAILADRGPITTVDVPLPGPDSGPVPFSSAAALPIESIKLDTARFLDDKLGPTAASLIMRIERTKTMSELLPLLAQATQTLRSFSGAAVAEEFVNRFMGGGAPR